MNTVRKIVESDDSGTARVEVNVAAPRRQVEVIVVWHELAQSMAEWPAGWFEHTAASIDDPTFARPLQGEYETRESLV